MNNENVESTVEFNNHKIIDLKVELLKEQYFYRDSIETMGVISFSQDNHIWLHDPSYIDNTFIHGGRLPLNSIKWSRGSWFFSSILKLSKSKVSMRFTKTGKFSPKLYYKEVVLRY